MATKNDNAWTKFIAEKNLPLMGESHIIDASELKAVTSREPRLLAKFDTPEQLPTPLREKGYTLLPIKNGQYLLFKGNIFLPIDDCLDELTYSANLPFPLFTLGRGSGESQYIDQAFTQGILNHFFDVESLFLTIRGRERTKKFAFQYETHQVEVDSVQIEVDAGYEGEKDIVLLEAKIGRPHHFNIRQLYYPYRHFRNLVPRKRIRPALLTGDLMTSTITLREFGFADLYNPLSIIQHRCISYRIGATQQQLISALEDPQFFSEIQLVPQADDLNRIFELVILIAEGQTSAEQIADAFGFDIRQSSYYREAARFLGLLAEDGQELTQRGWDLLQSPIDQKQHMMAKSIINSWLFQDLILLARQNGQFTGRDIENAIRSVLQPNGKQRYSGSTVGRRRQTITAWLAWLIREFSCLTYQPTTDSYHLR